MSDGPRLRLVKVVVQPVLVLDDGDTLQEVQSTAVEVMAADWSRWSAESFSEPGLAKLRDELLGDPDEKTTGSTE